jgi:2-polyprenyl-6-methoxyphenol hydroxylase-like FAD-dependent oxidoreductase
MKTKNLKVLIIGGGIGGLCLAQGLKKAGINFVIFERNKDNNSWLEGYRLNINPIGSAALYQCLPPHLWNAFLAGVADPKEGIGFMTEKLKELIFIDEAMMVGYSHDPSKNLYAAGRKTLRYVLQAGLENEIIYGKDFERYEQLPDGKVKAIFDDGSYTIGDVLIGADGANSKVRQQLLPNAKRVTTDAVAVGGKTMLNNDSRKWLAEVFTSRMNVIMPLKKYFFFTAAFDHEIKNSLSSDEIKKTAIKAGIDPDKFFDNDENYILWAFITHKNEFEQGLKNPGADVLNLVLNKIEAWHPDIKKLIKEANHQSVALIPLKVMLPIKNWKVTNVTILGDAVHNMPPLYGMGANMALHDAVILSAQLNRSANGECSLSEALHLYQEKMLKDGFKALNTSMTYTKQAISNNILQRIISRAWFKLCAAIPFFKKMSFGARWVQ